MGFLSPAGMRSGFKVIRQMHRRSEYLSFASDSRLAEIDDEEIKRQMLGAARRNAPPGSALPGDDEGLFFRVYRWEEALCMGTPGMLAALADVPAQLAGSIGNLFLAGDYMGIPSVNGALSSGCRAAEGVAALLATSPD